jgi:hypothetical protein
MRMGIIKPLGRVVAAAQGASFKHLDALAADVDVKGCFFNRGANPNENEIEEWLQGIEEDDHWDIASSAVIVNPAPGCDDEECTGDGPCTPPPDKQDVSEAIRACSESLVASLPSSFRDDIRRDSQSLAEMCVRMCPGVPCLIMKLELLQHNACWRWHQDNYIGRTIICYTGQGTWVADDASVQWDLVKGDTNEVCVAPEDVKKMELNSILLMKGSMWPGIRGRGLTHKSPQVDRQNPPKRLLLKVDLERHIPGQRIKC